MVLGKISVMRPLNIDCARCVARGPACNDCIVKVICGFEDQIEFDAADAAALNNLVYFGMVPPPRVEYELADGTHG